MKKLSITVGLTAMPKRRPKGAQVINLETLKRRKSKARAAMEAAAKRYDAIDRDHLNRTAVELRRAKKAHNATETAEAELDAIARRKVDIAREYEKRRAEYMRADAELWKVWRAQYAASRKRVAE